MQGSRYGAGPRPDDVALDFPKSSALRLPARADNRAAASGGAGRAVSWGSRLRDDADMRCCSQQQVDRLFQIGFWIGTRRIRLWERLAMEQGGLRHVDQGTRQQPTGFLQRVSDGNGTGEI